MIAIFILNELSKYSLNDIRLVELGPGRGTLMADILRTIKQFPDTYSKIKSISLVDASPFLKSIQKSKMQEFMPELEFSWYERLQDVPKEQFTIFIAHEFFDALPVFLFKVTIF